MAVIIMKRRKAYNVVYTVQNDIGTIEKKYETFYDYQDALKEKSKLMMVKQMKLLSLKIHCLWIF